LDYNAWRKVWESRPWKRDPARQGPSFFVTVLLEDGREYGGTFPGPDSHTALAGLWRVLREYRTARNADARPILDWTVDILSSTCTIGAMFIVGRTDPDRTRTLTSVKARAESARFTKAIRDRAATDTVRARLDCAANPLVWTEKELALASSRADALAAMLAAEKSAIRRIRHRMEREKERKSAER
jgi:hypothetical protein